MLLSLIHSFFSIKYCLRQKNLDKLFSGMYGTVDCTIPTFFTMKASFKRFCRSYVRPRQLRVPDCTLKLLIMMISLKMNQIASQFYRRQRICVCQQFCQASVIGLRTLQVYKFCPNHLFWKDCSNQMSCLQIQGYKTKFIWSSYQNVFQNLISIEYCQWLIILFAFLLSATFNNKAQILIKFLNLVFISLQLEFINKMNSTDQSPQEITTIHKNSNDKTPMFSFARERRFSLQKPICQAYYSNVQYRLPNRRFHMGSGARANLFQGRSVNPSPGQYDQKSQFDQKSLVKKGFSFGSNRDQIKFQNYLKKLEKTPAPGQYDIAKNRYRNNAYSLRERTKDPQNNFLPKDQVHPVPGPGQYKPRAGIFDRYQMLQNRVSQTRNYHNSKMYSDRVRLKSQQKSSNNQNSRLNQPKIVQTNQLGKYGSVNLNSKQYTKCSNLRQICLSNGPLMDKLTNNVYCKNKCILPKFSQNGSNNNSQKGQTNSKLHNQNILSQKLKENARFAKSIRPITAIQ